MAMMLALLAAGCGVRYDNAATQDAITRFSDSLTQTSEKDGSRAEYLRKADVSKCPLDVQEAWNDYLKALDDYQSALAKKKSGLAPFVVANAIHSADVEQDDTRQKLSNAE